MKILLKNGFLVLWILAINALLFAGTTGKIVGTIKDKSTGEPLVGANVVLEGSNMGSSSDIDGFYSILNVPPGTYTLTVNYIGYATVKIENVQVSIDRTTTQEIKISPEAIEGETVVVEAVRPAIEMDRTHSASIVNAETVELMPVTEISEVIALQSGVVSSGGELHFRGGRAREVTYIVDGVPVTNSYSQSGGSNVTVETNMVQEVEVITGTFNAEYGSAQSGVVNIVTKKPNQTSFNGNVQTYVGEWVSNKTDTYIGVNDINPFAEKDVQFSLTGPLIRGKLAFFISGRYNEWESLDWYEKRYNLIDGWRIAAYQRWVLDYAGGSGEGFIKIPDSLRTGDGSMGPLRTGTSRSMNAKLSFNPFPSVSLMYQAFGSYDDFVGPPDPDGNGADQFRRYQPDGSGTSKAWEYSHFVEFKHVPFKNLYYNLSFSFQHNDGERYFRKDNLVAKAPGQPGIQPITAFSNGFSLGSTDFFYVDQDGRNFRDQYVLIGNINWQVDRHNSIKSGFEVKQHYIDYYVRGYRTNSDWVNNAFPSTPEQTFGSNLTYDEYWHAMINYWTEWEDSFKTERFVAAADSEANLYRDFQIKPLEMAFYLQDKVELGEIIINAGLRLDLFQPNEYVPINYRTESFNLGTDQNLQKATVKHQLSPRLGISFPISSSGAFHASYGHFFQMPSFQTMYNEPLVSVTKFQLEGRRLGNADLEPETRISYEIGLQQEVFTDIAVDVTAYYTDYKNLLGIEQLTTLDRVTYTRYVNRDYGNSRGVTLDITKRAGFVNGGINYTLSYANGSASSPDQLELINTATQIGGESEVFVDRKVLPLDWDQRHTLNAFINFVKPNNWSIGLVGFVDSGQPFSPDFFARFDLNEREYQNSASKPTQWSVDLKAQKNFHFWGVEPVLFLKIDNLFDNLNHETVYARTGRADVQTDLPELKELEVERLEKEGNFTYDEVYMNPDFFSPPRKVQIGLDIRF